MSDGQIQRVGGKLLRMLGKIARGCCCNCCYGTMEVDLNGTLYTHTFRLCYDVGETGTFTWAGVVSPPYLGVSHWHGSGTVDEQNGTIEWEVVYDPPADYTGWSTSGTITDGAAAGDGTDTMEQTWTWSMESLDCFISRDCPTLSCNVEWVYPNWEGGSCDCIELDTNRFDSFLFAGASDDVAALIACDDDVTIADGGTQYTITLPARYILFQDTTGYLGTASGSRDVILTDGDNTYTWLKGDQENDNHIVDANAVIPSQEWTTPVTSQQLRDAGLVNAAGIARVKIAGAGDNGFVTVTGITCTPAE